MKVWISFLIVCTVLSPLGKLVAQRLQAVPSKAITSRTGPSAPSLTMPARVRLVEALDVATTAAVVTIASDAPGLVTIELKRSALSVYTLAAAFTAAAHAIQRHNSGRSSVRTTAVVPANTAPKSVSAIDQQRFERLKATLLARATGEFVTVSPGGL
jgi:hypothetical protein